MSQAKPFAVSKWQVMRAFELVKANAGAAGIDQQTLAEYEGNLQGNLVVGLIDLCRLKAVSVYK